MKNVLVLSCNPRKETFTTALAEAYTDGARQIGTNVRHITLADLTFDPILHNGYKEIQTLEPDLQDLQNAIRLADHLVFVYPTWWGDVPALLKGVIDRTILSGFGFKYRKDTPLWDKLLTGKSARIITTMDAPLWYYRIIFRSPGTNMLKRAVLHFCGVQPVRVTYIDRLRTRSDAQRATILARIRALAGKDVA